MDGSAADGTRTGGEEAMVPSIGLGASVVNRDNTKWNATASLRGANAGSPATSKNMPALDLSRDLSPHDNLTLISPDSVATDLASGWFASGDSGSALRVADLASIRLTTRTSGNSSVREAKDLVVAAAANEMA